MRKLLLAIALVLLASEAAAQRAGNVGRTYTDSQGSTTIYGSDGRVVGRTATDSRGVTTFYGSDGRKTGVVVPNRGR